MATDFVTTTSDGSLSLTTLQANLASARAAYHALRTGSQRERISHNGTDITYTRADADKLQDYISDLENMIAKQNMPQSRRRMIVNYFR